MGSFICPRKTGRNIDLNVLNLSEDSVNENYESLEAINQIIAPYKGKIYDIENISDKIF